MKMKRLAVLVLTLGLTGAVLTACSDSKDENTNPDGIVVTETPEVTATATPAVTDTPAVPDTPEVTEAPLQTGTTSSETPTNDLNGTGDKTTTVDKDDAVNTPAEAGNDTENKNPDANSGDEKSVDPEEDGGQGTAPDADIPDSVLTGDDGGDISVTVDPNGDYYNIENPDDNWYTGGDGEFGLENRKSLEENMAEYEKQKYTFSGNETPKEIAKLYMDAFSVFNAYKMLSCVAFDEEHKDAFTENLAECDLFEDEMLSEFEMSYVLQEPVSISADEILEYSDDFFVNVDKISELYRADAVLSITLKEFPDMSEEETITNYVGKVDGEYRIVFTNGF